MLQQILRDMWVDPELLAELGEDQKQTLFCRMREEQVRRWRIWDKEQQEQLRQGVVKSDRKTKVAFLEGLDGKPWTWVMGEHPEDKSIELILEEEAREKARKIAEKEAQELRLAYILQKEKCNKRMKILMKTIVIMHRTASITIKSQSGHVRLKTRLDFFANDFRLGPAHDIH